MRDAIGTELQHAWRSIATRPAFSALVVAVLAAGLACVLYVAALVNGFVVRPLPFANADQLYYAGLIDNDDTLDSESFDSLTAGELVEWKRYLAEHAQVGAFATGTVNLSDDERPERYQGGAIDSGLLATLGVQPRLGRAFTAADEAPDAARVVLLSDAVWRSRFGADASIVGREIRVNAQPATVVGVMPPAFSFPWREQVWTAAHIDPKAANVAGGYQIVLRPKPGVSESELRARLAAWHADAGRADPQRMASRALAVGLMPLANHYVDRDTRGLFAVMATAVVLVLLIACANVANLLLTRIGSRQQELALRIALGATRGRLMLGLLLQTGMLSAIALLVAVPLAEAGVGATVAAFRDSAEDGPPHWMTFDVDGTLIALAVLAAAATALLSGWLPALRAAAASDLNLRSSAQTGGGFARLSRGLVIGQIALSCTLLIASAMLVQTVRQLDRFDLGLDTSHVLTARIALLSDRYADDAAQYRYVDELLRRLRAEPGVVGAGVSQSLPGFIGENVDILAQGAPLPPNGLSNPAYSAVDARFLETMRATVVAGRGFEPTDDADAEPVIVVDQTFVDQHLGGGDAIGRQFVLNPLGDAPSTATIVGVVRPVQMEDIDDAIEPAVFAPIAQRPARWFSVFVRTRDDPLAFGARIRDVAADIDPDVPAYWLRDYGQVLLQATFGERVLAVLFGAFGTVALLLAAAGLYGVMAFSVGQRTREIGVRRALGAVDRAVLRDVLGRSLWQVGIGLTLGLVIGIPFAQVLASQIAAFVEVGMQSWAPALLVLVLVAIAAAWVPARRALRVEPNVALRYE